MAVRYYIEKWSNCVTYVFSKSQYETYLRFSFDSFSYLDILFRETLSRNYEIYEETSNFDVLLTVHLSVMLVINQLNAQIPVS